MAILGELDRLSLIHRDCATVHTETLGAALDRWDVAKTDDEATRTLYRAAPGGVRTTRLFSQSQRYPTLDLDLERGCIRDGAHAYSQDGGLAILYGNSGMGIWRNVAVSSKPLALTKDC